MTRLLLSFALLALASSNVSAASSSSRTSAWGMPRGGSEIVSSIPNGGSESTYSGQLESVKTAVLEAASEGVRYCYDGRITALYHCTVSLHHHIGCAWVGSATFESSLLLYAILVLTNSPFFPQFPSLLAWHDIKWHMTSRTHIALNNNPTLTVPTHIMM